LFPVIGRVRRQQQLGRALETRMEAGPETEPSFSKKTHARITSPPHRCLISRRPTRPLWNLHLSQQQSRDKPDAYGFASIGWFTLLEL
jgi:hypothetical protein